MAEKLKLGIIGMSDGNGHPYSWASIFNGFNEKEMAKCPFPVIPQYLSKQDFPKDFLSHKAEVTHVWTQDIKVSKHIALCSKISYVCNTIEELTSNVDAVLLARDDAENHYKYATPVLEAGLPIYIDKPFALDIESANVLFKKAQYENQIFTCSAMQFAKEFQLNDKDLSEIGTIKSISSNIAKSWDKYAVHIIEPVLKMIPNRGKIENIKPIETNIKNHKVVQVNWTNGITANFQTYGSLVTPIWIRVVGTKGYKDMYFKDAFFAFKSALNEFLDVIKNGKNNISKDFTLEMVQILETGRYA